MAAVELAEHALGLRSDRMGRALVEERTRGGVDVRVDRGAIEPGRAAADELSVPVHAASLGSSIAGQRFITTSRPASSARCAAASSITPSCIQTARAPARDRLVDVGAGAVGTGGRCRRRRRVRSPGCLRGSRSSARRAPRPRSDSPGSRGTRGSGAGGRCGRSLGADRGAADHRPGARLGQDRADRLGAGMNRHALSMPSAARPDGLRSTSTSRP